LVDIGLFPFLFSLNKNVSSKIVAVIGIINAAIILNQFNSIIAESAKYKNKED